MSKRVCAEPGCPNIQTETRCPTHRREREQARGSSTARGYSYAHQQERAAWEPSVKAGKVACRRCGKPIKHDQPWDLGHPDDHCPKPKAPEHAACNRAVVGR